MIYQSELNERKPVVGAISPQAAPVGTIDTDVVAMADQQKVMFMIQLGTLDAGALVDFTVYGDTDAAGAFATPLTGKAITQLDDTASDTIVIVEVSAEETAHEDFTHIRATLEFAGAGGSVAVLCIGGESRFLPTADIAAVGEIVA